MDEPLRIYNKPENGQGSTTVPSVLNGWLPAIPDRQILVIGTNEHIAAGRMNQILKEIFRVDARAFSSRTEESEILSSPRTAEFNPGSPQGLPYDSGYFDLVICTYLSASIDVRSETMREIGRVLRPDGYLLIIDNLVPGSRLRGKKAGQMRQAGEYVNTWMRLRNPGHKKYLDQDSWIQRLEDTMGSIEQLTICEMPQDFDTWADYYSPSPNNRLRLKAMLVQAPEKVRGFLTPVMSGDRIAFRMTEVFILAKMARGAE